MGSKATEENRVELVLATTGRSIGYKMRVRHNFGLGLALIALALVLMAVVGCASGAGPLATPTTKAAGASVTATPAAKSAAAKADASSASATGFANPNLLVQAKWLSDNLGDANLRIIDARTADDYKAGHIKGAVSLPVELAFNPSGPKQMVGSPEQIEQLFGEKGIGNDTRVIVYDIGKETKAARVLWTLEYFGHTNVAVLDGGFKRWQKDSLPTATEETRPTPAKFTAKVNTKVNATKEDILAILKKPGYALVDARSPEEYRGEDVRAKRGGHIPGAVNIDWRDLFTSDDAPVLKSAADLAKMYETAGVTKDKNTFVY